MGDGNSLPPLTHQRIVDRLEARGLVYAVDADGDIGGRWEDHVFYFFRQGARGDYLQVRGRWSRDLPPSEVDALTHVLNEWNLTTLWPKVYVRVAADDVGVYAEHTVDYESGISDDQLDLHMSCAVSTGLQFFARLDELYPQAVEAAQAKIAALRAADS